MRNDDIFAGAEILAALWALGGIRQKLPSSPEQLSLCLVAARNDLPETLSAHLSGDLTHDVFPQIARIVAAGVECLLLDGDPKHGMVVKLSHRTARDIVASYGMGSNEARLAAIAIRKAAWATLRDPRP